MADERDTRTDAELLAAAREDPAAFARFSRRHVRAVIAFFHRRTGDAELAADLTAETFAAALEGCRRYAPERGASGAWLYGIAHRQLATLQRNGGVERRARRRPHTDHGMPRPRGAASPRGRFAVPAPACAGRDPDGAHARAGPRQRARAVRGAGACGRGARTGRHAAESR